MKEITSGKIEIKVYYYESEDERDSHIKEMKKEGWIVNAGGNYNFTAIMGNSDTWKIKPYAEFFKMDQVKTDEEDISYETGVYCLRVFNNM